MDITGTGETDMTDNIVRLPHRCRMPLVLNPETAKVIFLPVLHAERQRRFDGVRLPPAAKRGKRRGLPSPFPGKRGS